MKKIPILLRTLISLTRLLPPFWRISGISNRIIKPIWCKFGDGKTYTLPIWKNILMHVDPCETVGGNLAFIPQLYDRWERAVIQEHLPINGVFVDVGSNIGAYSLWAASCLNHDGRVLAVDADPDNFKLLSKNVMINKKESVITCHLGGVADSAQTLRFYKNQSGNKGAHSFLGVGEHFIEVQCKPLIDILRENNIDKVDFMKLDIEGFEEKVLSVFFEDTSSNSTPRPTYLLVEIQGGPIRDPITQNRIKNMICSNGYELMIDKSNSFFKRVLP